MNTDDIMQLMADMADLVPDDKMIGGTISVGLPDFQTSERLAVEARDKWVVTFIVDRSLEGKLALSSAAAVVDDWIATAMAKAKEQDDG